MPDDVAVWQVSRTRHLWVLHLIKNAMNEQEPRLLRAHEIVRSNGKDESFAFRAIDYLEKHGFIQKVLAGEKYYFLLTQKGAIMLNLEDEPRFIDVVDVLEKVNQLLIKED